MTLPGANTIQFPDDISASIVGKHKWQIRVMEKAEEKLLLEDMTGASQVGDSDDEGEESLLEGGMEAISDSGSGSKDVNNNKQIEGIEPNKEDGDRGDDIEGGDVQSKK